jgi:hypothetical protein
MKKLLVGMVTVMGLAVCQTANATPLLLNGPYGVVIIPANPTDELAALTAAITAYNAAHDPDLPPAGDIDLTPQLIGGATTDGGGQAVPPAPTPKFITIDFGVERETYLGLTWDGPNGGTLFYYVGNETGPVYFESPYFPAPTPGNPNNTSQYGLSHYMFTGAVPDGGMTLTLLGLALAGLGVVRRRIS